MAPIRIDCPACHESVVSARHRGRRVRTIPGPDTWTPTNLEGAA